eukprot:4205287-Pyramimonas_sp.AAC.1
MGIARPLHGLPRSPLGALACRHRSPPKVFNAAPRGLQEVTAQRGPHCTSTVVAILALVPVQAAEVLTSRRAPGQIALPMAPSVSKARPPKKGLGCAGGNVVVNGKMVFNKWKHLPPQHCDTCDQDTHSLDRDCEKQPTFLVWTKTSSDTSAPGGYRLCGHECYACSDVRRDHFKGISQKELNEEASASSELMVKIVELRKKKVSGESKHTKGGKEQVDINTYKTKQVKSSFNQYFVEGSWMPLWQFVESHKLPYKQGVHSEAEVAQHIDTKYKGYKVAHDDEGMLGVEIPDEHKGVKRFRRGVK